MSVVLKDFIKAEGLEPGDRLPPERDLALKHFDECLLRKAVTYVAGDTFVLKPEWVGLWMPIKTVKKVCVSFTQASLSSEAGGNRTPPAP